MPAQQPGPLLIQWQADSNTEGQPDRHVKASDIKECQTTVRNTAPVGMQQDRGWWWGAITGALKGRGVIACYIFFVFFLFPKLIYILQEWKQTRNGRWDGHAGVMTLQWQQWPRTKEVSEELWWAGRLRRTWWQGARQIERQLGGKQLVVGRLMEEMADNSRSSMPRWRGTTRSNIRLRAARWQEASRLTLLCLL
jgi:hypothetical protein